MESRKIIEATKALQKYLKDKQDAPEKSNLFEDSTAEPIYLVVKTKRYFGEQRNLRPKLIKVPHSIWGSEKPTICLFSRDPQRLYKDKFLTGDTKLVDKVVGLSKLKGKYKRFEARRSLKGDYEIFVAEKEVLPSLPAVLGKTFYASQAKIPLPVTLSKDGEISTSRAEKAIAKVLESTVFVKPGSTLAVIRVGKTDFKPKHIAENIKAVVEYLTDNVLEEDFDGIRSLSIKSVQSPTLPIYYAKQIYTEKDIGTAEDNEESEAVKRKRDEQRLDELLAAVADEDEIIEYNREQKRKRKTAKKGAAAKDHESDEEAK